MVRKLLVLSAVLFAVIQGFAQVGQGTIKGKMIDEVTKEALPFANIVAKKGGSVVTGAQTDFDGKYTLSALTPGKYDIEATYVGYQPIKMSGVVVTSGKITFLNIKASSGITIEGFTVKAYKVPLIEKDNTSAGQTVTREDIKQMAGRSATSIASTAGGVYSQDNGSDDLNVRGARTEGTVTFIDGVKVRGSQNLPASAIDQVSVLVGGVPAEYGDATGGIVSITTRGASSKWFGGVELMSSGFKAGDKVYGLDSYGFNLFGFSLSGPLWMSKPDTVNDEPAKSKLGFFVSGELRSKLDPRPSAVGDWIVNEEKLNDLQENPISINPDGGVINNASYLRSNDLEYSKYRRNVGRKEMNFAGKIDVVTTENSTLTFGGGFDYNDRNTYQRNTPDFMTDDMSYSLLNFDNNPNTVDQTWRVYGRYTQRFPDLDSGALVKNAYVSFQVDYSNYNYTESNSRHGSNLSDYGYIGKFSTERSLTYADDTATVINDKGEVLTGYLHNGWESTAYNFERDGDINPVLSNYAHAYYELYENDPTKWESIENVVGGGGLINGSSPSSIYDMWTAQGSPYNRFIKIDRTQLRFQGSGSAEIKGHTFKIGFEYEQRNESEYDIRPSGLWNVGRNIVNSHLEQLDFNNYYRSYFDNNFDRITFESLYNEEAQSTFSRNVREALGYEVDGKQWIDFDSYGSDLWGVGYFSADELINNWSSSRINYFGYDHAGNKTSGNSTIEDFFTKQDENGDNLREVPSFKPIYMAGYIEDKFSFEDLVFRIGVRVDRYDANQPVLKDPHSLLPFVKAGEIDAEHPSNIGDDYAVYVSSIEDPNSNNIVGYRNGEVWYNGEGAEINDPTVLSPTGVPFPWLVNPDKSNVITDMDASSFQDYEPQVNVMPRIAFSFPISEEALFYAQYDVLTQRPKVGSRLELLDYLLIQSTNNIINNPNLKAERTINYELGFQQKLDDYSALKLSAFYKEQKDMIQVKQVIGAYPENYTTYANFDFGTVKGLSMGYDMRRRGNVSFRATYTLQFADGTGSDENASLNLVSSGNGNLRSLVPLSFDQRHAIVGVLDYRYKDGKDYNGPVLFGKKVFQNMGANLTFRMGSGTPYTKQANVAAQALFSEQNTQNSGSINGSRLPWTSSMDLRIDRSFDVTFGSEDKQKKLGMNVYLQVLNLLDAQNPIAIYNTTGNSEDDGYLAEAQFQALIENSIDEQSYRDLYTAKLSNPYFFSLPRRIRLGLQVNF